MKQHNSAQIPAGTLEDSSPYGVSGNNEGSSMFTRDERDNDSQGGQIKECQHLTIYCVLCCAIRMTQMAIRGTSLGKEH